MKAVFYCAAVVAIAVAASTTAEAQSTQRASISTNDPKAAAVTPQGNADANAANWRYRRQHGRWWYWTPANEWVVWQNNAWTTYRPGMVSGPTTARLGARRYSLDPSLEQPGPVQRNYYPRVYRAPRAYGANRSIRYAGSKANFDYAPYTGGSVQ